MFKKLFRNKRNDGFNSIVEGNPCYSFKFSWSLYRRTK